VAHPLEPFVIKRGDLDPPLEGRLVDRDGEIINRPSGGLAYASALYFFMRPSGLATAVISTAVASIVNASDCQVAYVWAAGQTDASSFPLGTRAYYQGELSVLWKSGRPQRVPHEGFIPITIEPKIPN
jgi:hypothetical protein